MKKTISSFHSPVGLYPLREKKAATEAEIKERVDAIKADMAKLEAFLMAKLDADLKAGKIDFRVEKTGIVHVPMGKASFGVEKLLQNVAAFLETLMRLKPASSVCVRIFRVANSTASDHSETSAAACLCSRGL